MRTRNRWEKCEMPSSIALVRTTVEPQEEHGRGSYSSHAALENTQTLMTPLLDDPSTEKKKIFRMPNRSGTTDSADPHRCSVCIQHGRTRTTTNRIITAVVMGFYLMK